MIDRGKVSVLGVRVNAVDYEAAVEKVIGAARARTSLAVSALAVHGVMTGVGDPEHQYRLNHLDLVTPDGQPVRWSMNLLGRVDLKDRVYGPTLMLKVCERAAEERLGVFLYGSRTEVLDKLKANLLARFPDIIISGCEASKFRSTSSSEQVAIAKRIESSGAHIVFVGLGCPRQEVFAFEYRKLLPIPILAVGAAFDYHAGLVKEPPAWVQRAGLQWLYRLAQDPRRLWHRYLVLNTKFVWFLMLQMSRLWRPKSPPLHAEPREVRYG